MWVRVIPDLVKALQDPEGWESLDITYETPHVERLWRPYRNGRMFVHRVLPCRPHKALRHPHPWPSWVGIMDAGEGDYEHGVGWHDGTRFRLAARQFLSTGDHYSMNDPEAWHYVAPHVPVLSVMITGEMWDTPVPFPKPKPQPPLSADKRGLLLDDARRALRMVP